MPAIHIIKNDPNLPDIIPIEPRSNYFRSGFWAISEQQANSLIGGRIYFYERPIEPSFFGGIVTGTQLVPQGEHAGRVVFICKFDPTCKEVTTPHDGWSQEMKITA